MEEVLTLILVFMDIC